MSTASPHLPDTPAATPYVLRNPITHKYLQATWDFIRKMERKHSFTISSASPVINGLSFKIFKTELSYSFECLPINHVTEGWAQYQQSGYGFFDKFLLKNRGQSWELPDGIASLTTAILKGTSTGLVNQVHKDFKTDTAVFHRLVLCQDLYHETLTKHIETDRVQVGSIMRGGGLVNVSINNSEYTFYDFTVRITKKSKEQRHFYIDSKTPVLYADFEKAIGAMLQAAAFITGELPRNELYIIQADDPFFYLITGAQFRKIEKSVDKGLEVVSPRTMRSLRIGELGTGYISQAVLSTLATRAYNDARMLRALKIVVESAEYPLEIRGATYSVALETVKNIVLEAYEDTVKPFKVKSDAKKTISQLKAVIDGHKDEIYNDRKAVVSRIENINSPTNSAGFATCFQQVEVELTAKDLKVLNNRNDFLHGRLPFEGETQKPEHSNELQFVVYKYHFLLSALVLKLCGYHGYVKDNSKFFDVQGRGILDPKEALFRLI